MNIFIPCLYMYVFVLNFGLNDVLNFVLINYEHQKFWKLESKQH